MSTAYSSKFYPDLELKTILFRNKCSQTLIQLRITIIIKVLWNTGKNNTNSIITPYISTYIT